MNSPYVMLKLSKVLFKPRNKRRWAILTYEAYRYCQVIVGRHIDSAVELFLCCVFPWNRCHDLYLQCLGFEQ